MADDPDLIGFIEAELERRNWSARHLSIQAGLSHNYVRMLIRLRLQPEPETIEKLASALRVSPQYLAQLAGYPVQSETPPVEGEPLPPSIQEVVAIMRAYPEVRGEIHATATAMRDIVERVRAAGPQQAERSTELPAEEPADRVDIEAVLATLPDSVRSDPEVMANIRRLTEAFVTLPKDEMARLVHDVEAKFSRDHRRIRRPDVQPPIPKIAAG